jgi:hypothetical protein
MSPAAPVVVVAIFVTASSIRVVKATFPVPFKQVFDLGHPILPDGFITGVLTCRSRLSHCEMRRQYKGCAGQTPDNEPNHHMQSPQSAG